MYEGKRKENLMYGTGSATDRVLRAGNDRMGRGNGDTGKDCGRRDHNTGGSRPELRNIKLPAGLKSIDSFAFNDCSGLTEIEIPEAVWYIGECAFDSCDKLTGVKLPSKLTMIKYGAFYGCSRLTSMTIPAGVTDIESGAWQDCTAMNSLSVVEGNTSFFVKDNVLFNSVTLAGKKLKAGTDYAVTYQNNKNIGKASVTITGKGNYAGSVTKTFTIYAKKGTTVTSGAYKYKLTSTSEVAFAGLKSVKTTKVVIPKTVKIGGKTFKVTSIAKKALYKKSKVKSVTIGANVKTIGASAFQNCKKLSTITVKTTKLKSAGKNAFKGIKANAKIKVPSKKLKAYKKLLKSKGQGTKVKIVKK